MSSTNTAKPKLACEIAADRVLAGRVMEHGGGLEASAARELAPGSVVPDLVEMNLRQRAAVRDGIASALVFVIAVSAVLTRAGVRRGELEERRALQGGDRNRSRRGGAHHARGF